MVAALSAEAAAVVVVVDDSVLGFAALGLAGGGNGEARAGEGRSGAGGDGSIGTGSLFSLPPIGVEENKSHLSRHRSRGLSTAPSRRCRPAQP